MVGTKALFDLEADPGQKTNVIDEHPEVARKMLAAYEEWWKGARPNMVNEDAALTGRNTFKTMYWEQYNITPPPPRKKREKKKKKKP